jgi:hypothetical protein
MVLLTNMQFYLEESNGNVDYQGYIFPRRRGELVSIIPTYLWYACCNISLRELNFLGFCSQILKHSCSPFSLSGMGC